MDERKRILWTSLLLTILIFAIGILLNHWLDVFRISTIVDVMRNHEIDSEAYQVESFFTEEFGGEECAIMESRIGDLKDEIRIVGEDLGTYSRFSFFRKKDYDYLKRKYFLLEFSFLSLIQKLNRECDNPYLPIVFFYEIDDKQSERQGFILQDLSREYERQLIVLSLDKDYKDEPLVGLFAQYYNVSSAPTLVVNNEKYEGIIFTGQLNATINQFLRKADPYASAYDFMFTPNAAGINTSLLLNQMQVIAGNESADNFARGDALLIMGRLLKNDSIICSSLEYFDRVNSTNPEERALIFETSASLGCGRNRPAFLRAAAEEWKKAGNMPRAKLLSNLAGGKSQKLVFDDNAVNSNFTVISGYKSPIVPELHKLSSSFIIGSTKIILNSSSTILSQTDRVYRDWLGGQLQNPFKGDILVTFSERLRYNESELLPEIGWHEGARVRDLKKVNLTHLSAVGTLVAKKGSRWFASDDKGVFRFEVPLDKLLYPTTRFLRRDLAVIIDTHGVNMLVEQSLRNNVSAVISDCDHPGKVYAAKYLSDSGVPVACFPDKYVYLALGHNLSLVGSPPIIIENETAVIGGRPLEFNLSERFVAVNSTDDAYALWYYQTPASYMAVLENAGLNVTYVSLDDFGQMSKATGKAREIKASVLAARIFSKSDYDEVKLWLEEDSSRKVIVFHTASYPYGQKLLREFPQVTFDDPNVK